MQETWVQPLGGKDPLEKELVTHSSILAWKIPWMEEPGCLVGAVTGGGFFLAKEGMSAFWTAPGICWGLALAAGVSVSVAFLLLNLGLQYASASKVTMIAVSQLVLLTLLGRFVLHEPTNPLIWLGLTLACVGILLTIDLD